MTSNAIALLVLVALFIPLLFVNRWSRWRRFLVGGTEDAAPPDSPGCVGCLAQGVMLASALVVLGLLFAVADQTYEDATLPPRISNMGGQRKEMEVGETFEFVQRFPTTLILYSPCHVESSEESTLSLKLTKTRSRWWWGECFCYYRADAIAPGQATLSGSALGHDGFIVTVIVIE